MDAATRRLVRERAEDCCEYCRIHQESDPFFRFHLEHIVARQHGGSNKPENLALSCHYCNLHKGPNLTGVDPKTGKTTRLFHPREDRWEEHFREVGDEIVGKTAVGRTTVNLLRMNAIPRIELRKTLRRVG